MNKSLDERMKFYEDRHISYLSPLLPIYIRLDGRGFHSFTRKFDKPYDHKFCEIMRLVTYFMVEEFNADIGYTQSDEISIAWTNNDYMRDIEFGGKDYKLLSLLAAQCSVKFFQLAREVWPELVNNMLPIFDCRIVQFPSIIECANAFRWRNQDAVRNSIQAAAQTVYSHKELMNKNIKECREMLFAKGINWNNYPAYYKEGTFIRKDKKMINDVERSILVYLDLPKVSSISNLEEVLFNHQPPILKNI